MKINDTIAAFLDDLGPFRPHPLLSRTDLREVALQQSVVAVVAVALGYGRPVLIDVRPRFGVHADLTTESLDRSIEHRLVGDVDGEPYLRAHLAMEAIALATEVGDHPLDDVEELADVLDVELGPGADPSRLSEAVRVADLLGVTVESGVADALVLLAEPDVMPAAKALARALLAEDPLVVEGAEIEGVLAPFALGRYRTTDVETATAVARR